MELTYIFQALTTAAAAAVAGGLVGWCALGLSSLFRGGSPSGNAGRPATLSGLRHAHR